jgi:hypothetical protein
MQPRLSQLRRRSPRKPPFCGRFRREARAGLWQRPCDSGSIPGPEGPVNISNYDDRTINSWRLEPRLRALDLDEFSAVEQAPPLWKDLTLAAVVALGLWLATVSAFG